MLCRARSGFIQFAFVISFHIIFPAFTIGLAAWLATIEGAWFATGKPIYRRVFDFWLEVFAVSFGMGVVTGIVMAFPIEIPNLGSFIASGNWTTREIGLETFPVEDRPAGKKRKV
jgi:cytochrome bd-type quinol oxidase subunit 1